MKKIPTKHTEATRILLLLAEITVRAGVPLMTAVLFLDLYDDWTWATVAVAMTTYGIHDVIADYVRMNSCVHTLILLQNQSKKFRDKRVYCITDDELGKALWNCLDDQFQELQMRELTTVITDKGRLMSVKISRGAENDAPEKEVSQIPTDDLHIVQGSMFDDAEIVVGASDGTDKLAEMLVMNDKKYALLKNAHFKRATWFINL